jgi:hypothetical protein
MAQDTTLHELIHDLEPYLGEKLTTLQDGTAGAALYAKLLAVMQELRVVPNTMQIVTLHQLANEYDMRSLLLQIQWRPASAGCSDCD